MVFTVEYLKKNSNLPGPRSNLELLSDFTKNANMNEIASCLACDYLATNTEEEFVLTCGVSGSIYNALRHGTQVGIHLKAFANHESWRIRESICIGFQNSKELVSSNEMLAYLEPLKEGTPLELRTYIATLCEPALLVDYIDANEIMAFMYDMCIEYFNHNDKIDEDLKVLRKALGYCWSVALCGNSAKRTLFEKLLEFRNSKHIKWIIAENLKKKRLHNLDAEWVSRLYAII